MVNVYEMGCVTGCSPLQGAGHDAGDIYTSLNSSFPGVKQAVHIACANVGRAEHISSLNLLKYVIFIF